MCVCVCVCVCVCACVCVCVLISCHMIMVFVYLSYEANTSDIVVLELKFDKLFNVLHMLHTLPDLHIIC